MICQLLFTGTLTPHRKQATGFIFNTGLLSSPCQFQLCTGEGAIIQTTLMQTQHNLGLLCRPIQLQGKKILLGFLLTIELAFLSMLLREMFYQKVTLSGYSWGGKATSLIGRATSITSQCIQSRYYYTSYIEPGLIRKQIKIVLRK